MVIPLSFAKFEEFYEKRKIKGRIMKKLGIVKEKQNEKGIIV